MPFIILDICGDNIVRIYILSTAILEIVLKIREASILQCPHDAIIVRMGILNEVQINFMAFKRSSKEECLIKYQIVDNE